MNNALSTQHTGHDSDSDLHGPHGQCGCGDCDLCGLPALAATSNHWATTHGVFLLVCQTCRDGLRAVHNS